MNIVIEKVLLMAMLIGFWAMIVAQLAGCGSTTGWTVSFGVNPINQVDNQQVLQSKKEAKYTYAKK